MQTCTAEHRALWLGSWRTRFFTPPPQCSLLSCAGANRTPFLHHTTVLWCENSNLLWTSACFQARVLITNPLIMHTCTSTPRALLFSPVLHLHIFSIFHLSVFLIPTLPSGHFHVLCLIKGLWPPPLPPLRGAVFLKRIPNVSELLILHVSLFCLEC